MGKRVTINDIAAKAGVSPTTVSMILNHREDVHFSDETILNVLKISEKMGYSSQKGSKRNGTGSTGNVLLAVCPSFENMYYSRIVDIMQKEALALGYQMVSINTYRDAETEKSIEALVQAMKIGGVIFLYNPMNTEVPRLLAKSVPVLLLYDNHCEYGIDMVEMDNHKIGRIVGDYLLGLGHRDIAAVFSQLTEKNIGRMQKYEGLRESFFIHGIDPNDHLKLICLPKSTVKQNSLNGYNLGYMLTEKLLAEPVQVSAIAADNDSVAYGVMDAIIKKKKRIPQDYSVIGCDNLPVSGFMRMGLTTVETGSTLYAKDAIHIITRRLGRSEEENRQGDVLRGVYRVAYEPRIIVRNTTGKYNP